MAPRAAAGCAIATLPSPVIAAAVVRKLRREQFVVFIYAGSVM